jgi:hypothetical protein
MLRKALLALTAVSAMTLTGCQIYFGPPGDDPPPDCGWGCEQPPPGTPGGDCSTSDQCMAGCYCNDQGWCEESGFCESDWECPYGFMCDERATCVPGYSEPPYCMVDQDCSAGSYCAPDVGQCVPSWTCWSDEECGPGMACDDRGTCVPAPCRENADCAEGCYCDVQTGTCVETGFCEGDAQCFDGMVCEEERYTCVPTPTEPPPPATCYGEVFCDALAPECMEGTTPGIANGCYTGECIPLEQCEMPPPPPMPLCEELASEDECFARPDCAATYVGVNCTCQDGQPCRCSAEDASCTCERYDYAGCTTL